VSEIMLQQTRVDTVERHWGRFMARFPDLASLASADEDAVLQQWSGLGYYRRARLLHRGAKHVHETLGGVLPSGAEQLREIPGVGPYTAGAIASIAFDQPAALVDGNVARVHSRLAGIEAPAEQDAKAKSHWKFVARVLGHGQPRVLAQALMELGATVCTPRSPSCLVCPVRKVCRAHASGRQDVIPAVRVKAKSPEQQLFALALRRGDRLAGQLFRSDGPRRSPQHGLTETSDFQESHEPVDCAERRSDNGPRQPRKPDRQSTRSRCSRSSSANSCRLVRGPS
jgi:A/G-specific adenine glycosylase